MTEKLAEMWNELASKLDAWFVMGFIAQCAFGMRFLIQWIASEKAGKSVVPEVFWYLSILGSAGLLVYAVKRADPLFILAYSLNSFIYIRNLMLIHRNRRPTPSAT